jgi:hypothetical protein
MSKAKAQSIPRRAVKAAPAEYKVVKKRLARIAVKDSQTMAFLHARGLDVEPKALAAALRVAIAQIEALYRAEPGQEGLTAEEVEAARSGGLDPQPARGARRPARSGRCGIREPHPDGSHDAADRRKARCV